MVDEAMSCTCGLLRYTCFFLGARSLCRASGLDALDFSDFRVMQREGCRGVVLPIDQSELSFIPRHILPNGG